MKYILFLVLVVLFFSCKEKKSNRPVVPHISYTHDSVRYDTAQSHLTAVYSPQGFDLYPATLENGQIHFDERTSEEKRLDKIIELLKEQNKLLNKILKHE